MEKIIIIKSEPEGADVFIDQVCVGKTPLEQKFKWYGNREIYLQKEGYQVLRKVEQLPAPFYQYFPLDFFVNVLLPFTIYDIRTFHYKLTPATPELIDEVELLKKVDELRKKLEQKK